MPYELDYKKVHNTLRSKTLENVFGYQKGQVANLLKTEQLGAGSGYKIYLTEKRQQYVIQNTNSAAMQVIIKAYTNDGQRISFADGSSELSISIVAGKSQLIEVPTNEVVYQDGAQKNPYFLGFTSSNITLCEMWMTDNNICGSVNEDGIIASVEAVTPFEINFLTLSWTDIDNFLNGCTLSITRTGNDIIVSINDDGTHHQPISLLREYGFSTVLVPMKYTSSPKPLKSITNMRNSKQTSIYEDKYKKVSLYLEPIVLNDFNHGSSFIIFSLHALPLSTNFFTATSSRQGYTTYGLKMTYKEYALDVCRGCGYQDGTDGGITNICFALGIQIVKETAPHSGCSLEKYRIFNASNQVVALSRVALARTDNQNCVINLPN